MAVLKARLFRYTAAQGRPRAFGPRLLVYLALTLGAWVLPPWGALAALVALPLLGRNLRWSRWLRELGWLWLFVLAPFLTACLEPVRANLLAGAWRGFTFLALLAASHWLSATSTVFEIRAALAAFFRLLGPRAAGTLGLAGALALAFIPWVLEQAQAVREAAELRGVPARRPLLALRALALPLSVRLIEKARHTAESLELRGS